MRRALVLPRFASRASRAYSALALASPPSSRHLAARAAAGHHLVWYRGFAQQAQQASGEDAARAAAEAAAAAAAEEAAGKAEAKGDGENSAGAEEKADKEKAAAAEEAEASAKAEEGAAKEPELTEAEKVEKALAEAQESLKAKKHELLLTLADFENSRKKFLKEREVRRRNASVTFARKMVEVYGELEELTGKRPEEMTPACEALFDGVVMTKDVYKAALDRGNVSSIVPEPGQPFVASLHEDAGTIPSGEAPAGSVAEVVLPGFQLPASGGSAAVVLRRAKVRLAAQAAE
eukprot:TRINITY_DN4292_c0_g1_i1.p1 TRINITY_DN4292_c0_g1~~TRINITY_DN4292_c0_g1_i1.p1  ORF type:complete len:292 (+),score=100.79 TRINITY_DN4292_c0_g1_i1:261-1136(+)